MKGGNNLFPYYGHLLLNFCTQEDRQAGSVHAYCMKQQNTMHCQEAQ